MADPALRQRLRRRLLQLSYRAFLECVIDLLQAQGYQAVRPAGRRHWKGRNQGGGWDAEADLLTGDLGRMRCIIQVKQFDTLAVHQRSVDELRGSCLRAGAHQAILVTLSTFSAVAQAAAGADTRLVPVRLIDGNELLDLLIERGIGVRQAGRGVWRAGRAVWELDEAYFDALSRGFRDAEAPASGKRQGREKPANGTTPSVMITLKIGSRLEKATKPEHL